MKEPKCKFKTDELTHLKSKCRTRYYFTKNNSLKKLSVSLTDFDPDDLLVFKDEEKLGKF